MKINRTTQRSIEICRIISKNPYGMTLEEICEEMKLPKTSAYDIVVTLVETGMLETTKNSKIYYHIGLTAYSIGMNYTNHRNFAEMFEPVLRPFSKELGKTVFYGIRDKNHIVYISKYEPENPIITTATVGTRNPMYCTSLGKAILANMEQDERRKIYESTEFKKNTDYTITNVLKLEDNLRLTNKRGYALDEREIEDHMECVGAPIFDQNATLIGAISASSLYKPSEDYHALGIRINEKARELSKMLGYDAENSNKTVDKPKQK